MASKVSLKGKVIAVTGGARGIGAATAKELTARGARVAIGDLDQALAAETAERLGGGAVALELDVTDAESFESFLDSAEREVGPIDVLINNAGIMPIGPFTEEDAATAARIFDINVLAMITGCKLALARMEPRGSGYIVNIASQAGKAGFPHLATYCASKHAVIGLTEALRNEYRETAIEFSVVMPAVVNTELTSGIGGTRFFEKIEPEDVATAIADALEHRRFDVNVPRSVGPVGHVMAAMPRRAREATGRALKAHEVMTTADTQARADYEARAAASAPAADQEKEKA